MTLERSPSLLCRFVLREGRFTDSRNDTSFGVQRCPFQADASGFCPVHRPDRAPLSPRRTPASRGDFVDRLLTWDESDLQLFAPRDRTKRRARST